MKSQGKQGQCTAGWRARTEQCGRGVSQHVIRHARRVAKERTAGGEHIPPRHCEAQADGASHRRPGSSDDAVSCFTVWRCDQKEKFHVDEPTGNQKRRRGARPDGLDQQKSRRSGARALLPNAPSDANRAQHRFDGYCGPTGAPTHHGKTAISPLSPTRLIRASRQWGRRSNSCSPSGCGDGSVLGRSRS